MAAGCPSPLHSSLGIRAQQATPAAARHSTAEAQEATDLRAHIVGWAGPGLLHAPGPKQGLGNFSLTAASSIDIGRA